MNKTQNSHMLKKYKTINKAKKIFAFLDRVPSNVETTCTKIMHKNKIEKTRVS